MNLVGLSHGAADRDPEAPVWIRLEPVIAFWHRSSGCVALISKDGDGLDRAAGSWPCSCFELMFRSASCRQLARHSCWKSVPRAYPPRCRPITSITCITGRDMGTLRIALSEALRQRAPYPTCWPSAAPLPNLPRRSWLPLRCVWQSKRSAPIKPAHRPVPPELTSRS